MRVPMGFCSPAFLLLSFWLFISLQCSSSVDATVFTVGEQRGWVVGIVNYTQWAYNHTFHVGDSLVFHYMEQFHNVLEVTKQAYENCEVSSPLANYDDGNTTINLKKAGSYYFICGTYQHCPLGQKLAITVLNLPTISAPAPAPESYYYHSPSLAPSPVSSSTRTKFCNLGLLSLIISYIVWLMVALE